MRSQWLLSVSLAFILLAGMGRAFAADDESEIAVEDLPAAVVEAVKDKFPAAKIEEAKREVENGKTIYELEIEDDDGQEYEIEITPDGVILEIEEESEDDDSPVGR